MGGWAAGPGDCGLQSPRGLGGREDAVGLQVPASPVSSSPQMLGVSPPCAQLRGPAKGRGRCADVADSAYWGPSLPFSGGSGSEACLGPGDGARVTTFHGGLLVTHPWLLLLGRQSSPREHSALSTTTSGASGPWPSFSPADHGSCTHQPLTTRRHHPRHPPSCDSLSHWQRGPREPGQAAFPRSRWLRPPGLTPVPRPRVRSQQLGTGLTFPPPHRQAPNPGACLEPAALLTPVSLCEAHSGSGGLTLPNSTTPAP